MPVQLKPELEELIKALPVDQQAEQRKIFEANPNFAATLGDSVLRQSDYSRKQAEVQAEKSRAEAERKAQQEWWATNKPVFDGLKQTVTALEEENASLKAASEAAAARGASAAAAGGTEIDEAKLAADILARVNATGGYVTKADLDKITADLTVKAVEQTLIKAREEFLTQTYPQAMHSILTVQDIQFNHRNEFSEPLDRKALSEFMVSNKIVDPQKAYDQMMAPRRETARVEAEVQKRLRDMRSAEVPGTVTPGAPATMGPLQIAYSRDAKVDPLAGKDVVIGDNQAALAAAAEMRAEGKV